MPDLTTVPLSGADVLRAQAGGLPVPEFRLSSDELLEVLTRSARVMRLPVHPTFHPTQLASRAVIQHH